MTFLAFCLILGIMLGWYARDIRAHIIRLSTKMTEVKKAPVKKVDNSGVIQNHMPYSHGKPDVITLPPYEAGVIVRPRKPDQVKKDQEREMDQIISELN